MPKVGSQKFAYTKKGKKAAKKYAKKIGRKMTRTKKSKYQEKQCLNLERNHWKT